MQRGRWRTPGTSSLIAAVAIGGAIAIAAAVLAYPPPLHGAVLRKALILAVLTALSELISIRLQHGESAELLKRISPAHQQYAVQDENPAEEGGANVRPDVPMHAPFVVARMRRHAAGVAQRLLSPPRAAVR